MKRENAVTVQSRELDEQLVAQFQQGNTDAFHELVERHQHFVLTCICRTVPDRYLAEDVAQDVWVKVYRSLHTYRGEAKFTTWLYRLTRNQLIDTLRKWKYHHQTELLDQNVHVHSAPVQTLSLWDDVPEERLLKRERCEQVQDTLCKLPIKYRTVMVLYHMRDRSYAEIAEQLAMPVRTVETRLYRAKSLFKRAWGQMTEPSVT
ncbi:sigma-70 family RNA polymerase sigma factor [Paenibacillus sp. ACRRX]|uniref:RNA polymerase sigma factor n=1 Tax=unclassified Paenibacillus TaxID=185978 RepID=UPI001EF58B98|nr:sigma-70 family RNA polymerase sigma factor [Paenibacillus sp. UMB4589-SE434]MCG7409779.1 sigma-70 family RNA polymerase sigma factor [Paenibacillus sp. ACRRX]MDK8183143.1 sigma-70 family RNA polymerase sigma factor [Paenibacillus sp. UMB4589-SE434]